MTTTKQIFVFGSNLAGVHGAGAALFAVKNHGAVYSNGVGLQGNSYAIPTKNWNIKTLPLDIIQKYVTEFLAFAKLHPEMRFNVTAIGTDLAGYKAWQIAPMFKGYSSNVILCDEFALFFKK
jgi:hypothetical protein